MSLTSSFLKAGNSIITAGILRSSFLVQTSIFSSGLVPLVFFFGYNFLETSSRMAILEKTYSIPNIIGILGLGGLILGMDISSMAIFIGSETFNKYFNYPNPLEQGLVAGANPSGALVGCIAYGMLSEKSGRVSTIKVSSGIWILGSFISIFVLNIWMVILSRLIKGVSVGIFSALLPVYIGEVIPKKRKGTATSTIQLALTAAILLMFYVCFFMNFIGNHLSFRISWGLEMIPALLLFFLAFLLPESPRWLVTHGKYTDAQEILERLKSTKFGKGVSKIDILDKYGSSSQKCTYLDLFKKTLWRHTIIGMTIQALVQCCGIGVLMYYVVYICEMIGLEGDIRLFSASIQYIINVLFTIFPIIWLDKFRRKDVIVYGSYLLAVIMFSIGFTMNWYGHEVPPINGNKAMVWEVKGKPGSVILGLCFLFVAIFAATLSCGAWLYTNEILPAKTKAKGMSICMATSWVMNFILTFLAPWLLNRIKWVTFIILGGMTLVITTIVAFLFPETYGLTDLEIEKLYEPLENNFTEKDEEKGGDSSVGLSTKSSAPSPELAPVIMNINNHEALTPVKLVIDDEDDLAA